MVIIQKTKQGSFLISLPKAYLEHMNWKEGTKISLCPCADGLKLVELKRSEGNAT